MMLESSWLGASSVRHAQRFIGIGAAAFTSGHRREQTCGQCSACARRACGVNSARVRPAPAGQPLFVGSSGRCHGAIPVVFRPILDVELGYRATILGFFDRLPCKKVPCPHVFQAQIVLQNLSHLDMNSLPPWKLVICTG